MKYFTDWDFWLDYLKMIGNWAINELPSILILILVFFLAMKFLKKLISKLRPFLIRRISKDSSIDALEAEKRVRTLVDITFGAGKVLLWMLFIIILLSKIGIEVAPLLAGAGIVGLAVGFGSQELVRDMISGFFILLENQIRVGDYAIINGTGGNVESVELRTITLRDISGTIHIFQNGKINTVSNMTKDWSASVFEIGVAYKENINEVVEYMINAADELSLENEFKDKIIEKIEIFGLDKFDSSAVIIKARLKTIPGAQWEVKREYQKRIKELFDKYKIEIPFPHTTIYWGENISTLKIKNE